MEASRAGDAPAEPVQIQDRSRRHTPRPCSSGLQVKFTFDQDLPVGPGKLSLSFSGVLNDDLAGFYRCVPGLHAGTCQCCISH